MEISFSQPLGANCIPSKAGKGREAKEGRDGEKRALYKEREEKTKKRGRKGERSAHSIEAQQAGRRHWKRARHQERHKDAGPLRYTAKLPLTFTQITSQRVLEESKYLPSAPCGSLREQSHSAVPKNRFNLELRATWDLFRRTEVLNAPRLSATLYPKHSRDRLLEVMKSIADVTLVVVPTQEKEAARLQDGAAEAVMGNRREETCSSS
ncbi:hypothetical protein EYF80_013306 [Liparis tanakae]|uniref:Uncharacterized protein n=1 Tax=Liparis tanakae TaxID=230148 RepID=A0A4Z2IF81_9TELE|nr:hypothetical protein EYF80_013306 [Liparis tanakae]